MENMFDAIGESAKRNCGVGVEGGLVMIDRTILRTRAELAAWKKARGLDSPEAYDQWLREAALETERFKAKQNQE